MNAKRQGTSLDVSSQGSRVLADPDRRAFSEGDDSYTTAEFFSGGFSGWTQSLRRLTELGYDFRHILAVDSDEVAAETFARSHGLPVVLSKGMYGLTDEFLPDHIFIQDSILSPEWYHLFSTTGLGMVIKSPPCPPWSAATACEGLHKAEGRLTLQSWGLCHLLKPKLVQMENVGNMRNHEQWPLLKRYIEWCGFAIRYARILNMADVAPQFRERLILIATHEDSDTLPHLCTGWPKLERQTLESYLNLMPLEEPRKSQCMIDPAVLKQYLDPIMLPKKTKRQGKSEEKNEGRRGTVSHQIPTKLIWMRDGELFIWPCSSCLSPQCLSIVWDFDLQTRCIEIHDHTRDHHIHVCSCSVLASGRSSLSHPTPGKCNLSTSCHDCTLQRPGLLDTAFALGSA